MFRFPLIVAAVALLPAPADAVAQTRTAMPSRITETSPRLHFRYSYPPEAAAIPKLAALLRKEGMQSLAESRRDSAAGGREPRRGPDEVEQAWQATADTRDLLALSSIASTYQDGAAHGYFAYRTLIWGKSARRPLQLAELFSDWQKGVAQLMAELCAKLRSEREQRSREKDGGPAMPMECPAAADVSIVPVAERGARIRSFRMMLSGEETPDGYAGGSYEIEVPVSPAVLGLVDPALRGSF